MTQGKQVLYLTVQIPKPLESKSEPKLIVEAFPERADFLWPFQYQD